MIAIFSYKLAFSMRFFTMAFNLLYLVLFGAMFASSPIALAPYGGDFISYLLIGSIGWGFLWMIMHVTATSLRQEMMMGTLESILLTPTKLYTMILGYSLYGLFFGLLSMGMLLIIGFGLLGESVFATATIWTLVIFILSATMMIGVGMIFSGLTIWQKNVGQTAPLLQNITMFFCGVYFPITVLPEVLQPVSRFIPFYYSIEGMRQSLLPNVSTGTLLEYVLILLGFTVGLLALGYYTMHRGLIKAKRDGSLAFY